MSSMSRWVNAAASVFETGKRDVAHIEATVVALAEAKQVRDPVVTKAATKLLRLFCRR